MANVKNIKLGRCLNIKNPKNLHLPKEEDVTIKNNPVSVDKPNQFSERKLKQPRKLPLNSSAKNVKWLDANQSKELKPSYLWTSHKSKNKNKPKKNILGEKNGFILYYLI